MNNIQPDLLTKKELGNAQVMGDSAFRYTIEESSFALQEFGYNEPMLQAIAHTLMPKGARRPDLFIFLGAAKKYQLDPLMKQIECIDIKGKITLYTRIDGFRAIAHRSGKLKGILPIQWCGEDGVWVDVWIKKEQPVAARSRILHADFEEPIVTIFYLREFKRADSDLAWNKHAPISHSAKCVEAQGLRRAFPLDLSGLYTDDEIELMRQSPKEQPLHPKISDFLARVSGLADLQQIDSATRELVGISAPPHQKEECLRALSARKKQLRSATKPQELPKQFPPSAACQDAENEIPY